MLRTNQKFHHKFSVFECMKIAQNYAQVSLPLSHTIKFSIIYSVPLFRSLGFIKRNLYSCSKPIKQTAYLALVRPLLEYSNSIWDPNQKELINKVEMVQKRAARFVTNTYDRSTSITAVIKDLEWNTLQNRRTANRLTILQKARQGLLALPVDQLLQPTRRQSRHSHPDSYQLISCNKNVYKYSYFPKTLTDWNNLSHSIVQIQDPANFKAAVLEILKQD